MPSTVGPPSFVRSLCGKKSISFSDELAETFSDEVGELISSASITYEPRGPVLRCMSDRTFGSPLC